MTNDDFDWLTAKAAADLIGIAHRTLLLYAQQGKLETRRMGRALLISRASAKAVAEERRKNPPKRGQPFKEGPVSGRTLYRRKKRQQQDENSS